MVIHIQATKILLLLCLLTAAFSTYAESEYDAQIEQSLSRIEAGELATALELINQHIQDYPSSSIGQLLRADILKALSLDPRDAEIAILPTSSEFAGLRAQLRNRWQRQRSDFNGRIPSNFVHLGEHEYVLAADLSLGRLFLFLNEDGIPSLVADYYLAMGAAGYGKQYEGDNKTPVGIYSFYDYIEPSKLPDLYGTGAFPVDYPNRLDRFKRRTGYGIWLHGTPSHVYARNPLSSEGCFVLNNADLDDISQYINVQQKTPVVLADQLEWITPAEYKKRQQKYMKVVLQWKRDWESLDTEQYLQHYSHDSFNFGQGDFSRWADRKRIINRSKTFVQLDLDIEEFFLYPGEQKETLMLRYKQRYLSNNYEAVVDKQQYWQKSDDGKWKILFEG